jgi:hypothetical protein
MLYITPFGTLTTHPQDDHKRVQAVLRALDWCQTLAESSSWLACAGEKGNSLERVINRQTIEVFPLEAAKMDLGQASKYSMEHLPITLNGMHACVRSTKMQLPPLHTDMVASVILLLGHQDLVPEAIPRTLHPVLTDDQRASLPQPRQRERHAPGQPSTSGRTFLPEQQVLSLLDSHQDLPFHIQFELRSGRLHNMTARDLRGVGQEDMPQTSGAGMNYDPAQYHLKTVVDQALRQFRSIAIDRVTMLAIGDELHRTESAEDEEE